MRQARRFGALPGGREATLYTLTGGGLRAEITDLGAALVSLTVNGRDVVLGYDTAKEYLENPGNMGATVGRYANRIARAAFTLGGVTYHLPPSRPPHCLHGGVEGFQQRLWHVVSCTESTLVLGLESPDGDQGFPGNMKVTAAYSLEEPQTLALTYRAVCDRDTVCSLTNHTYWNLAGHDAGHAALCGHVLTLPAAQRAEVDGDTVPTGAFCDVAGTVFDLRRGVRLGDILDDAALRPTHGLDHPYCLSGAFEKAAGAAWGDLTMEVWTDQPCMQVYSGNGLAAGLPGKGGAVYGPHASFCLETQQYPDAPNHPQFPSPLLRREEERTYRTVYRFVTGR